MGTKKIVNLFRKNVRNIPGWRTNRKIVVFESDDWGSERTRSKEVIQAFTQAGYPVEKSLMNLTDTLESNTDLEMLFEVLFKHKDKKGNRPVISACFNVANPDYQKIKNSGFSEYHYLDISQTAKQYLDHNRITDLYQEGFQAGIFHAAYHGREHLNAKRWLRTLREGNKDVLFAFDLDFYSLSGDFGPGLEKGFRATYDLDFEKEYPFMLQGVTTGIRLFKDTFGFQSDYFVPPDGPYPRNRGFEKVLMENAIQFLGGPGMQRVADGKGGYIRKHHYLGQSNEYGQTYITRNGIFEPQEPTRDWINYCLQDIKLAFAWRKPAIISTHRSNYMGYLDPKNREKGLKALDQLIRNILNKWPEVEFMSSAQLNQLVKGK